jgi:SAM-dependent methyltransferase
MSGQRRSDTSGSGVRHKIAALRRFATDPHYRSIKFLAWFGRHGAFQPYGMTRENRYPQIFAFVQDRLKAHADLNILSFGCATGEEVFTLRRYFAAAAITGIDINPTSVALARKRLAGAPDPRIRFVEGASAADEAPASYDAIFCMAVLRDGRLGTAPPRCDHLLRFADFERTVGEFARALKPGGLLAIRHSNFRFTDTVSAAEFETVLSHPYPPRARITPVYGPDDRLIEGARIADCVFMKRG